MATLPPDALRQPNGPAPGHAPDMAPGQDMMMAPPGPPASPGPDALQPPGPDQGMGGLPSIDPAAIIQIIQAIQHGDMQKVAAMLSQELQAALANLHGHQADAAAQALEAIRQLAERDATTLDSPASAAPSPLNDQGPVGGGLENLPAGY